MNGRAECAARARRGGTGARRAARHTRRNAHAPKRAETGRHSLEERMLAREQDGRGRRAGAGAEEARGARAGSRRGARAQPAETAAARPPHCSRGVASARHCEARAAWRGVRPCTRARGKSLHIAAQTPTKTGAADGAPSARNVHAPAVARRAGVMLSGGERAEREIRGGTRPLRKTGGGHVAPPTNRLSAQCRRIRIVSEARAACRCECCQNARGGEAATPKKHRGDGLQESHAGPSGCEDTAAQHTALGSAAVA